MIILALCLFGTALAAPAILEAPLLPSEPHGIVSSYISYSAPILPLRTLEMNFELEHKEENADLQEPEEVFTEPKEPKDELLEEPKEGILELPLPPGLPILEAPKPIEPVVVNLEVPKPPSFISNWFSSLPISFPNFSFPSFIGDWFRPPSNPKLTYPAYSFYTAYPGAVIVDAP